MWVKVCDAMLAKAVESFKTVTQILVTRHASVNLKMVKPCLISWWIQEKKIWRRLSDSYSTAWQANVWLEAARPRGRCCTWNARRIRGEGFRAALYHVLCCVKNVKITTTTGNTPPAASTCWRSSATAATTSATARVQATPPPPGGGVWPPWCWRSTGPLQQAQG